MKLVSVNEDGVFSRKMSTGPYSVRHFVMDGKQEFSANFSLLCDISEEPDQDLVDLFNSVNESSEFDDLLERFNELWNAHEDEK